MRVASIKRRIGVAAGVLLMGAVGGLAVTTGSASASPAASGDNFPTDLQSVYCAIPYCSGSYRVDNQNFLWTQIKVGACVNNGVLMDIEWNQYAPQYAKVFYA